MKSRHKILKKLIQEIEISQVKNITEKNGNGIFKLWADPNLLSNLSGWIGALCIRALLNKLQIDENRIFKWRLENKFIQYLILNHYSPNCMADTIGLNQMLSIGNNIEEIYRLFEKKYFLKSALGDGSFRRNDWDKTAEFEHLIHSYNSRNEYYEKWVFQKKLELIGEFRVHTFGKDIIYGLSLTIQGVEPKKYTEVEKYVKAILDSLPEPITYGTLIAWDIGLTDDRHYIIEANFTGFHPEYRRGFQTTGFVDDNISGPIICAWLNNYFKSKYGIAIGSINPSLLSQAPYFKAFLYYSSLFKIEHFFALSQRKTDDTLAAIIYLGENTEHSVIRLINYFLKAKFADQYYVITARKYLTRAKELFGNIDILKIIIDSELFTGDQYKSVVSLDENKRKQACCDQLAREINQCSYMII